ncbi:MULTISPECIES: recombination mediator RecR [Desulfococcus]|jgi:recombination protein RecR|uniref:Recombination protein RecR n=1 Tax=Desulfococcus multivorans DSM 2059 TaxID=1121405 RepID=S7TZS6_DESML|nr:recombination mediator RecR [Desulfococcus multivorans]AOY58333.1 RecR: recombination protein R [Desulfococcus multivorans]AQV00666.1 recombination protein RecR [Desulfococcus multivorans]EPR42592.1 Recombination protein recR [Desulfococcus multivorans DSM 2059]MDX9817913.1 recombination mediator RecR [Desulfococcus multivorans]SKA18163.1 DNA replication and repair protein RecR [Desulfococcus multivorans DSM 2059]
MMYYPPSIRHLIRHLATLPGIGEKTAERLALHLVRARKKDAEALAYSILNVKEKIRLCSRCFGLSDTDVCSICNNPSRDAALLCVVENVSEMIAIERSGAYYGRYHILQGALSPMDGIGPDDLRITELFARIDEGEIKEIILATNTHLEGESTARYLSELLERYPVKVTRIASGVPLGGDLKYVDQLTLKRAMETRYVLE